MIIQIFSDLHFEFFKEGFANGGDVQVHPQAEVVVLAGDIDLGEHSVRHAHRIAYKFGKPVVWVPGNHEYYRQDYLALSRKYRNTHIDGVFLLMNNAVVIDDVRFCGNTLWTDFALYSPSIRVPTPDISMQAGEGALNDFRLIRYGDEPFFAKTSLEEHKKTRAFLEQTLATPFAGKTVVVSHHAPHGNSIHPRFSAGERVLNSTFRLPAENPYWWANPCFASNLTPLLEQADLWVHGHVHNSFDYHVGKCRVIANPRGYPVTGRDGNLYFENIDYDHALLVEV
jgi:predicted phosphodiesterase